MQDDLSYMSGFGSYFESEAEKGTLPVGQNSPQQPPKGLYPEQINGSAFTRPRAQNLRSWLYRIKPSVVHPPYEAASLPQWQTPPFHRKLPRTPAQLRWDPHPWPDHHTDLWASMTTMVGNGDASSLQGMAIHTYAAQKSQHGDDTVFFCNSDAEMMFLPVEGPLLVSTEMGLLKISPGELVVIPRGIKFCIDLTEGKGRGYCGENFGLPFVLPELGPIGANGLANPRDFYYPKAHYMTTNTRMKLLTKYRGHFWQMSLKDHPLDVVAWHGNYAPYKYDMSRFNTMNSVSFDHPDPSIFTVLTSPSPVPGVANADFVIFPPRWMVAEHTFRIPYYHRNIMSEFMGLIQGTYDAKPEGFLPGGASLHNCMAAHGPDAEAFEAAVSADDKPTRYKNTLAFMFESFMAWDTTDQAMNSKLLQKNYAQCWQGLKSYFS